MCEAVAALWRCCGALRWCCGAQFIAAAGQTPPPDAAVWALPSHGYVRSSSPPQRARGVGVGARAREEATAPLLPPGERRSSAEVANYTLPSCNNHSLAGPRVTPTPTRKLEFDEGLGLTAVAGLQVGGGRLRRGRLRRGRRGGGCGCGCWLRRGRSVGITARPCHAQGDQNRPLCCTIHRCFLHEMPHIIAADVLVQPESGRGAQSRCHLRNGRVRGKDVDTEQPEDG